MEKVFGNSRVSDCTIMIKLAIANKIITVSSCHTPKVGLNAIKDALYDQLQDTVRKTGADKTLAICSDLNGHNGLFKSHGLRNKVKIFSNFLLLLILLLETRTSPRKTTI